MSSRPCGWGYIYGNIVCSLKDSAPGHDEIGMGPLRSVLPYIDGPLTYLCNLSLRQGIFPDILKIANVIPLYKKDNPMLFNYYRPVSLLCSLSKILERVMHNRVISYLEYNKILFKYQFGFRKSHSTYLALTILMDKITKSLENDDYVIGVFLISVKLSILWTTKFYCLNYVIVEFDVQH